MLTTGSLQGRKVCSPFDASQIAVDRGDLPAFGNSFACGGYNERVDFDLVDVIPLMIMLVTRTLFIQIKRELNSYKDTAIGLTEFFHHFQLYTTRRHVSQLLIFLPMGLANSLPFV